MPIFPLALRAIVLTACLASALPPSRAQEVAADVVARPSLPASRAAPTQESRTVDVLFADGGKLQLVLDLERIEIESPYGKLSIPIQEIHSLEFATRLPAEVEKKINEAIFRLGSVDFSMREAAQRDLMRFKEKAYPAIVLATKHADLEVAQRAQELVVRMRGMLPPESLEVRQFDIVTTPHSTIAGRISTDAFQVHTTQFGVQKLKLSDIRNFRSPDAPATLEEIGVTEDDPGTLSQVRGEIGKTFAFRVTGRADSVIWGTDIYTTDSALAMAAVHAGALKVGETGIVRVKIVPPPPAFTGSARNDVTSSPYGAYPGAYEILLPKR